MEDMTFRVHPSATVTQLVRFHEVFQPVGSKLGALARLALFVESMQPWTARKKYESMYIGGAGRFNQP